MVLEVVYKNYSYITLFDLICQGKVSHFSYFFNIFFFSMSSYVYLCCILSKTRLVFKKITLKKRLGIHRAIKNYFILFFVELTTKSAVWIFTKRCVFVFAKYLHCFIKKILHIEQIDIANTEFN